MNSTENRKPTTENPPAASGRPREHCGVFGIYGHLDAARITFFGLYALQICSDPAHHPWRPGPGQR